MAKKTEQKNNVLERPPVVVVLGHVDHGKTSLLNAIRQLVFTDQKPGGAITQHIGAYQVEKNSKKITFVDTPGHEAFSAMRSRGATVADIAVLVVDACEGVQPQTKEAIFHIKKAGISMVVALNKIDKPQANIEKAKGELAKNEVVVESMAGKIPAVETSAKTNQGIPELLEVILLVAEMEGLKADFSKQGEGVVVEAYSDQKRGPTATLLLRDGVLNKNDIIATPSVFGKVKILEDFRGKTILKVLPSMPVVVLGLEGAPQVGEKFRVFSDLETARAYVIKKERKADSAEVIAIEPGKKVLNLILKTDVRGSLEAISQMLKGLPQEKIVLRILKAEAGDINDSDLKLAEISKASIVGFRVKTTKAVDQTIKKYQGKRIPIRTFEIIYELVQEIRQTMEKMVAPEIIRKDLGKVKALIIFKTQGKRQIIGGKVIEGIIQKGAQIEVFRQEQKVGVGRLINLQKNKKDFEKLIKGDECGIQYEGNVKIQEGDILQMFVEERIKTGLE